MILETVTILYYTLLATVSIGLVLYKNYNNKIHEFINKHFYKYTQVPSEENDLDLQTNLDNDKTYILFNDEIINNENNQNIFEMNTFNNNNNSDNINNINNINLQKI